MLNMLIVKYVLTIEIRPISGLHVNSKIKKLIRNKFKFYKLYMKTKNSQALNKYHYFKYKIRDFLDKKNSKL